MYPVSFASKLLAHQVSKEKTKFDNCVLQWRTVSSKSDDEGGKNRGSPTVANAALGSRSNPYVDDMYKLWRKDNKSVHSSWDAYFKQIARGSISQNNSGRPQSDVGTNKIDRTEVVQFVRHKSRDGEQKPFVIQIDIFDEVPSESTAQNSESFSNINANVSVDPMASIERVKARSQIKDSQGGTPPGKEHITHPPMNREAMVARGEGKRVDEAPSVAKVVQAKVVPPKVVPPKVVPPKVVPPNKIEITHTKPIPSVEKKVSNVQDTLAKKPVSPNPQQSTIPPKKQIQTEPQPTVSKIAPKNVVPSKQKTSVTTANQPTTNVRPRIGPQKMSPPKQQTSPASATISKVPPQNIDPKIGPLKKAPFEPPPSAAKPDIPQKTILVTPQSWEQHTKAFKRTYLAHTKGEIAKLPTFIIRPTSKTAITFSKRRPQTPPGIHRIDRPTNTTPVITKPEVGKKIERGTNGKSSITSGQQSSSNPPLRRSPSSSNLNANKMMAAEGSGGVKDNTAIDQHLAVQGVIRSYQARGHLIAHLDPLGILHKNHPSLEQRKGAVSETIERQHKALAGIDTKTVYHLPTTTFIGQGANELPLQEIIKRLEEAYCRHIGVEFMYIHDMDKSLWIREYMETPAKIQLDKAAKIRTLKRLIRSVRFESFLQKKYVGEKRFGLEGSDALIPCILQIMDTGSELGLQALNISMAHRGRLNVLANVCGKPLKNIFTTFEPVAPAETGSGDVKYHLGTVVTRELENKKKFRICVMANPSHLEPNGPVALGKTKCEQFMNGDNTGDSCMALLIHGDAAFCGQGVVYEGFHLSHLPNFTTHGTIHLVVNNQVGFTTDPRFSRSSPYCTDVGRVVLAPILHVNGDDVEAVVKVSKMAMEWRQKFKQDVVIDLVSYRRNGHNELDEPMFTQPLMYQTINKLPNVEKIYTEQLIKEGVVSQEDVNGYVKEYEDICEKDFALTKQETHIHLRDWIDCPWKGFYKEGKKFTEMPKTGVAEHVVQHIAKQFATAPPSDFVIHKGVTRILSNRMKMVEARTTDWSFGEALAYASLMKEGYHVRLAGQDVERGTFSHRHHILHHQTQDKKIHNMLANMYPNQAPYSICNSSLSEYCVLAFEMGYSQVSPYILDMWEAQFGDFCNTAQVIMDCFLCSGQSKWFRQCGFVMLLPHGLEGMGPEHSSARLERFLQLCDDDVLTKGPFDANLSLRQLETCNWIVASCSVPANLFHILRRQMMLPFRKPLMLMTPKSTLRSPKARSPFEDYLTGTQFLPVIPDAGPASKSPDGVKHLIFCCGHTFFDVSTWVQEAKLESQIAVTRTEQLSPFPYEQVAAEIKKYKNAKLYWAQEEHKNQGAWLYMRERIVVASEGKDCAYLGRGVSSAPASGNKVQFQKELQTFKNLVLAIN